MEQLYPFPMNALKEELGRFPKAEVVWCQDEPKNMGYWQFVEPRIEATLTAMDHGSKRPRYVGRNDSASPATGLASRHAAEQAKLVDEALTV